MIISSYGMLWRVSKTSLRLMCQEVLAGREVNYDDYGKRLGQQDYNLTDLDKQQAAQILEDLK